MICQLDYACEICRLIRQLLREPGSPYGCAYIYSTTQQTFVVVGLLLNSSLYFNTHVGSVMATLLILVATSAVLVLSLWQPWRNRLPTGTKPLPGPKGTRTNDLVRP